MSAQLDAGTGSTFPTCEIAHETFCGSQRMPDSTSAEVLMVDFTLIELECHSKSTFIRRLAKYSTVH